MGELLSYSIVGGLIMFAMYLADKLFIARDNQHSFNRGVLLSIYPVSFCAYPLYNIAVSLPVTPESASASEFVGVDNLAVEVSAYPAWPTLLIRIYLIGVVIVSLKTITTWIKIIKTIHSGQKIKQDGYVLVVIDNENIAPFSWMRYVVISRTDFERNISAIITHERKHVSSFHWIDLLLAQTVCIFDWYNPAAWLMRDELMLVHEYQADMSVIESGHNPQEYQMLLIKKAVGSRFPSLANSINHSKLKKRITMMYRSKSGAGSRLKALALVPMVALALGVTTVPAVKAAVSAIGSSELLPDKSSENLQQSPQFKIVSLNSSGTETTVVVSGEGLGSSVSVSGVSFSNKGNVFNAKSLKTDMADGIATITAVFPFSDSYENAGVTLIINGNDVTLYPEDFRKNSQSQSIKISPSNGIAVSKGDAALSAIGDMEIYLDGKKISEEELKSLPPEKIASITIDKQDNVKAIIITSK